MSDSMFLILKGLKQPHSSIEDYLIAKEGGYCVVRRFVQTPTDTPSHSVRHGKLKSTLFLYEADTIVYPLAVVPEMKQNGDATLEWLVISNREVWLCHFQAINKSIGRQSMNHLYNQYSIAGEDVEGTTAYESDSDKESDESNYLDNGRVTLDLPSLEHSNNDDDSEESMENKLSLDDDSSRDVVDESIKSISSSCESNKDINLPNSIDYDLKSWIIA